MSFVLKLKALASRAGRFLRSHSAARGAPGKLGARDPATGPTAPSRGTAFAPHSSTLNPAFPGPDWRPSPLVQQQARFSEQCTLQAVFDWYQGFLDGSIDERMSDATDGNSAIDPDQMTRQPGEIRQVIPGFPQFSRQIVDRQMDVVRVRFFDSGGREAGALLLRPEADRCTIEVPDGPLFVVRETTTLAGLTDDLKVGSVRASPISEVE